MRACTSMGKRSSFPRRERDYYKPPGQAVPPLIPHLPDGFTFAEPCAGDGTLIRHLESFGGRCVQAFDIEPQGAGIDRGDVFDTPIVGDADFVITNSPWSRPILHRIIDQIDRPTWLLFDANWIWTQQAVPYYRHLITVQTIGRLKWIPDSPHTGKDDCAWFHLDPARSGPPVVHGRVAKGKEQ